VAETPHAGEWYQTNDVIDEVFSTGADARVFKLLLAVTSQRNSVPNNTAQALHLFLQYRAAGRQIPEGGFKGGMEPVLDNAAAVLRDGVVAGSKIGEFVRALEGDTNAVVTDVWMARAFGLEKEPTDREFRIIRRILTRKAATLGTTPRDLQAMIWRGIVIGTAKERAVTSPYEPEDYESYGAQLLRRARNIFPEYKQTSGAGKKRVTLPLPADYELFGMLAETAKTTWGYIGGSEYKRQLLGEIRDGLRRRSRFYKADRDGVAALRVFLALTVLEAGLDRRTWRTLVRRALAARPSDAQWQQANADAEALLTMGVHYDLAPQDAVEKYDPAQPRDAQGQWAATGLRNLTEPPVSYQTERLLEAFVGHQRGAVDSGIVSGLMDAHPLEDALRSNTPEAQELERAFAPLRETLRDQFGDVVPLWRFQTHDTRETASADAARVVLSWSSNRDVVLRQYAGERPVRFRVGRYSDTDGFQPEYGESYETREEAAARAAHFTTRFAGVPGDPFVVRRRAGRKASTTHGRVVRAMIPLDDVVWYTNRAGQDEFIVRGVQHVEKFNPYHDNLGRFTTRHGSTVSADPARTHVSDSDREDAAQGRLNDWTFSSAWGEAYRPTFELDVNDLPGPRDTHTGFGAAYRAMHKAARTETSRRADVDSLVDVTTEVGRLHDVEGRALLEFGNLNEVSVALNDGLGFNATLPKAVLMTHNHPNTEHGRPHEGVGYYDTYQGLSDGDIGWTMAHQLPLVRAIWRAPSQQADGGVQERVTAHWLYNPLHSAEGMARARRLMAKDPDLLRVFDTPDGKLDQDIQQRMAGAMYTFFTAEQQRRTGRIDERDWQRTMAPAYALMRSVLRRIGFRWGRSTRVSDYVRPGARSRAMTPERARHAARDEFGEVFDAEGRVRPPKPRTPRA
jgi:hypothetical protein